MSIKIEKGEFDVTATCNNCPNASIKEMIYETNMVKDVLLIKITCSRCRKSFTLSVI